MFRALIEANGNSENVYNLYWKRARTFLAKHPKTMELRKEKLRSLIGEHIDAAPVTSGIGLTAAAVWYYWTMRLGEHWCACFDPDEYTHDQRHQDAQRKPRHAKPHEMER